MNQFLQRKSEIRVKPYLIAHSRKEKYLTNQTSSEQAQIWLVASIQLEKFYLILPLF